MNPERWWLRVAGCALPALWVAMPPAAAAQPASATIAGTVRDASGRVLPGAAVTLREADTRPVRQAIAGAAGQYEFGGLRPAAVITLESRVYGFRPLQRIVADLAAGERRLVDLRLQIAGVGERVEVTGDTSIARATSPELGGTLPREQIARLPVDGRDLLSLAYLIPGAAPARGFYNLAPRLTINGSSSLVTNYSVDGFDNTDLFLGGPKVATTIGATGNLTVLVNSYRSEYGRTGNGVFAVTTRSGSNAHRGELFYTVRPGAALDSPNFFAPRDAGGAVVDDSFRRHQTGGWAGGPVARDRIFYFADLEITREREDAILTSPLALGLAPTGFDRRAALGKVDVRWSDRQSTTIRSQFSDDTFDGSRGFVGGLTLPSAGLEVNYRNSFGSVTHRTIGVAGVNEAGLQIGQLRSDWRSPDTGPRVIVTDRGATLAVLGSTSDNFFWTESDLQVRNVYTRLAGRHTLKAGGDLPFAVYSDTLFNRPDGGAVSVTFAPGTPFAPPVFPAALPRGAIDGLPLSQLPPRNVQVFDPELRSPWTKQASAGYVFSLTGGLALAVDYVRGRGHNLIRRVDTNAPASLAAGSVRSVADADATRPVVPIAGGLRLIERDESTGRSTYDGLYLNARQRFSDRFAFDVAYTLSRIRNNTDDINFRPVDSRRPDDEMGPSLNDRRHVLAVNGLVRAPLAIDVVPVLFLSSGQPLNVTTGRDGLNRE